MTHVRIVITTLLLSLAPHVAVGQSGERGIPFRSEHYAPSEYGYQPQNWDIVQDDQGLMYVANNDGVLQYDGERWRLIPTTTGTFVRSLAADSLIYVGAKGDFGYLRPDSVGVFRYNSLREHIPEGARSFEDVWSTHVLGDRVYYQTNQRLFRWNGEEITSWISEEGFHTSFVVGGTLYVRDSGRGLLWMHEGELKPAPGGETFRKTPIYMMERHPSGGVLVGTQNKGLVLKDEEEIRPLAPELTSYLQENDLYHGSRLPGNRYALATLGGGVLVIDAKGNVVRVFDSSSGLPDKYINHVYTDREGQLWMALNSSGVFRVGIDVTVHDERTGLEGTINKIHTHMGTTHVATKSGLYVLEKKGEQELGGPSAQFERWGNLPIVWDMMSVNGELLVATQEKGGYRIENGKKERVADWNFTYDFIKPEDRQFIYAGTRSGLKALDPTQEEWGTFSVNEVQGEVRSLAYDEDGTLWASTIRGDVFRVVLSADGRRAVATTQYDVQDGLPEGYKEVDAINGRVTIISEKGLFQIGNRGEDPGGWRFRRRSSLLPDVQEADTIRLKSVEEAGSSLWVALENRVYVGQLGEDGTYAWDAVDPLHFPKENVTRLSVGQDSTVWLGSGARLFHYEWGEYSTSESPADSILATDFSALVRTVTTLREDQVVYGGGGSVLSSHSTLTLPFGRGIRIDVAAPFYSTTGSHEYRYKLTGISKEWSEWVNDASRQYVTLPEGTYDLQVQARNDRREVSNTASLTLTVQPPWYRTVWAYLLYGTAFIGLAFGFRRYRQVKKESRRARERVRELERERVVAERLKKANERLREANRLKEDFLATTSHELRTPLTNILGALEVLRDMVTDEQAEFLDMIEQNGQRLKRTLNALLDLSMLRSGNEDLNLSPTALNQCVRRVASDLREEAKEKGLAFQVHAPDTPVQADVDEQYLEQILRNLIENAIKYTHEGHVAVSVGYDEETAYVEVEDTGIGIDQEFLPDLFEEFKQESRGRARTYEGNGLGLAISARLAEQMDGTIRVETEKDQGSTFTVEFPRSSDGSPEAKTAEVEAV